MPNKKNTCKLAHTTISQLHRCSNCSELLLIPNWFDKENLQELVSQKIKDGQITEFVNQHGDTLADDVSRLVAEKFSNFLQKQNGKKYPKSYFYDKGTKEKAEFYGLTSIENEDLTPNGLVAKMKEWQEESHGVVAYIYDITAKQLKHSGKEMPKEVIRVNDT